MIKMRNRDVNSGGCKKSYDDRRKDSMEVDRVGVRRRGLGL
jgi:hypothetical protein